MFWYFIGGLFAGSIIGMMVAALFAASSDSTRERAINNNFLRKEYPMNENEMPVQAEAGKAENAAAENPVREDLKKKREEMQKQLQAQMEEVRAKSREANEALGEGKGRLRLETLILAGDEEVKELAYDFTVLTGMEYIDAMDTDPNAMQIYRITYRQALALFATAAAKQTDRLDMKDITSRIGATDAVEAVQLATLFFTASTRAGRLRISKR